MSRVTQDEETILHLVLTEAIRDIIVSSFFLFLLSPSVIYIEIVYNKKKESKPYV